MEGWIGGRTDGRMDGWTGGRTDRQKIFTHYSGIALAPRGARIILKKGRTVCLTVEVEAAAATTAMAKATGNNQPCTKANKAVAVGLCVPRPTSGMRIGTTATHMAVTLKMATQAQRATDEDPSTTQMPHGPT